MLVDSKTKMLKPQEIILEASQHTEDEHSPEQVYAALVSESHMKDAILMRQGNTLFVVHKGEKRIASFRALNADTANNYLQNSVTFTKAMYMAGFDVMVSHFTSPALLKIFKYVSKNPPQEGMGFQANRLKDGSYQVVVQLGKPRKGEMQ
jgi:hypothetical protein